MILGYRKSILNIHVRFHIGDKYIQYIHIHVWIVDQGLRSQQATRYDASRCTIRSAKLWAMWRIWASLLFPVIFLFRLGQTILFRRGKIQMNNSKLSIDASMLK